MRPQRAPAAGRSGLQAVQGGRLGLIDGIVLIVVPAWQRCYRGADARLRVSMLDQPCNSCRGSQHPPAFSQPIQHDQEQRLVAARDGRVRRQPEAALRALCPQRLLAVLLQLLAILLIL